MYCAKCGVKLDDSLAACPLCGTRAYHPDIDRTPTDGSFPREKYPALAKRSFLTQVVFTVLFLLPLLIVPVCDFQFTGQITWSGYVIGAVLLGYLIFVLPTWFRKPNMVIFVPCSFVGVLLYLLYIDLINHGGWFLSFAFPVTGGIGLITTAVVVLVKYVPKGSLYTFGGAFIALGGYMVLVEWLMDLTFQIEKFAGWSLYPMIVLVIFGGLLLYLAIHRPAREALQRKTFI